MKIILDAMGGDNAPEEIVKGALLAVEEFKVDIVLVGHGEQILKCLHEQGYKEIPKGIEIAHASDVITMEDDPTTAVRRKKDSSMTVALKLLKDGGGDAMVSAGSTGALLSGATLVVKRIRGIRRAAMAPYIPTKTGGCLLIDCGANVECTPEYLLQFAYMGSYYVKSVIGIPEPRVGILNIGTEDTKGLELQKETGKLLKNASKEGRINFIGNIEAREVALGGCDVVVTDGFSGNVFLKTMEGVGLLLLSELKKVFTKNLKTKIAAALVMSDIKGLKKRFDVSEVGGTALLGISKPVIKAHGSSDAYSIRSAISQAISTVNAGVVEDIQDNVWHMRLENVAEANDEEKQM